MSKSLLVIGGSSEIAHSFIKMAALKDYSITITCRNEETLNTTCSNFYKETGRIINGTVLDLTDLEKVSTFFDDREVPDVLFIAAGTLGDVNVCQYELKNQLEIINVNYTAVATLLASVTDKYKAKGDGHIVVISSVAGDRGYYSNYVYCSAKAAISTYLSGLRAMLYPHGVNVLDIKCGLVETKLNAHRKKPKILTASPDYVGMQIFASMQKRHTVVYTPLIWYFIMGVVKMIPECIFKKIKL